MRTAMEFLEIQVKATIDIVKDMPTNNGNKEYISALEYVLKMINTHKEIEQDVFARFATEFIMQDVPVISYWKKYFNGQIL